MTGRLSHFIKYSAVSTTWAKLQFAVPIWNSRPPTAEMLKVRLTSVYQALTTKHLSETDWQTDRQTDGQGQARTDGSELSTIAS